MALLVFSTGSARAAEGGLDASFGSAGVAYPWGTGSSGASSQATASVLQTDGKLIVVGVATNPVTFGRGFSVVRLNTDGTLDTAFGTGGRTYVSFTGGSDVAKAVRLLPDGSIVVAGSTNVGTCCSQVALARLTPDGALDPTFGSGGTVRTTQSSGGDVRLVINSVGQAVVLANNGAFAPSYLLRFTPTGAADLTFGSNGTVKVAFSSTDPGAATALVLAPQDAIVVAGYASPATDGYHFALARYTSAGALDAAFGSGGTVIRDMGYKDNSDSPVSEINDLASGPDGTLYAFGELYWVGAQTPCCGFGAVPHDGEGAILGRFTGSGTFVSQTLVGGAYFPPGTTTPATSAGLAIAAGADGGLFGLFTSNPSQLVRFTSSGAVDSTFGNGGHVDANFGGDANGRPLNVVVQADGRPLVVGDGRQSSTAPVGEVERFLASVTSSPVAPGPAPAPAPAPGPAPAPPPGEAPCQQTPAAAACQPAALVRISSGSSRVSKTGATTVTLTCSQGSGHCSGTLTLTIRVRVGHTQRTRMKTLTLAKAGYSVAAGHSATITLHLTPTGRQLLDHAPHQHLRVSATTSQNSRQLTLTPASKPRAKSQ